MRTLNSWWFEVKNILIVDDEEIIVVLYSRVLKKEDYCIFTAYNGMEAVDILGKESIDVVISDTNMPFMNGFELLDHIREKKYKTKIIMMTGRSCDSWEMAVKEKGASYALQKPISINDLQYLVEECLK